MLAGNVDVVAAAAVDVVAGSSVVDAAFLVAAARKAALVFTFRIDNVVFTQWNGIIQTLPSALRFHFFL